MLACAEAGADVVDVRLLKPFIIVYHRLKLFIDV
jgi:hypothetical protein